MSLINIYKDIVDLIAVTSDKLSNNNQAIRKILFL